MKKALVCCILIVAIVLCALCLSGCAEIINTEQKEVEVTIEDVYYKSAWMQPVFNGKYVTYIYHSAHYEVHVNYDGVNYTVSGRDAYDKYKDNIGETFSAILVIDTYDDGNVKKHIVLN